MPPPPSLPDRLSLAAQLLTVLLLGLMAGFFATYSANVNLATLELNGPTYAQVQSAFNRNVRHAGFFACFFGPPPLGLLALAAAWPRRKQAWWLACNCTMVPAHGARRVCGASAGGSIARPSPIMRPAKTGSGTCSSGTTVPARNAVNVGLDGTAIADSRMKSGNRTSLEPEN